MNLYPWAIKWGISVEALADFRQMIGVDPAPWCHPTIGLVSETGVSKQRRLLEAKAGNLLWRNNVGAMQDETGRMVRYGLANESTKMNKVIKSSDLIGIRSILIDHHHVGSIIGQFTAFETKAPNWTYSGTPRETAQLKYGELVISRGGHFQFDNGS